MGWRKNRISLTILQWNYLYWALGAGDWEEGQGERELIAEGPIQRLKDLFIALHTRTVEYWNLHSVNCGRIEGQR